MGQFKSQVDGDRLTCTQTGYIGKFFVCALAAIRFMMLRKTHGCKAPGVSLPQDSIGCLLAKRCPKVNKRPNGNA